jgi:penicillin-binding protein 1B
MGLTGSSGALRVWGDIMATIDNQSLSDAAPDSIELASACGSTEVPFSRGYAGVSDCGHEGDAETTGASEQKPKLAQGQAPAPSDAEPPRREREEPRNVSPFMSDFYGN